MNKENKFKFYDRFSITVVVVFAFFNLIDLIITFYGIRTGNFQEANLLPKFLLNQFGYVITYLLHCLYISIIVPLAFLLGKFMVVKFDKKQYSILTREKHYLILITSIVSIETLIIIRNILLISGVMQ